MALVRTTDVEHNHGYVSTWTAAGGVIALFAVLGVGLGIYAFLAPFGLPNQVDPGATVTTAQLLAGSVFVLLVGLLPILAAPVLTLGTGAWAGHVTRDAGKGAIAGAVGGIVGAIVMLVIVGIMFAIGAAAAGFDVASLGQEFNVNVNIPPGLASTFGFLFSVAGLTYLLVIAIIGALAGAVVGAMLPDVVPSRVTEREVVRGPA